MVQIPCPRSVVHPAGVSAAGESERTTAPHRVTPPVGGGQTTQVADVQIAVPVQVPR
jgi:hypothetical protein